ncbi:hypothetical protein GCM10028796_41990 [Ramlibacter monticola]|uniref:Uncharacterized protein n=1 Tax=Ramlibacter monticola TaxID=1926872 RepID=A0A936Z3A8_9BURK|nr:hypothetical protein [Ramlibacter monticola]MBL0392800.1 hypothetical protein [Ramlibacter monticola]
MQEMNDPIDEAYDAWKEADAVSRALDREVTEAWHRHDCEGAAPPSRDLMREAAWLRHAAHEKLDQAIRLLHDAGLIQPSKDTVRAMPRASRAPGPCLI